MDHHDDRSEHDGAATPQQGHGDEGRPEPDQHDPGTEEDTASGGAAQEPDGA
ncbi:hypothetical protein [Agrococcus carbonis]|uniref:Uncharacterized protein n=1 Tax=Agrococcus carbonis TaxID=684552 RepID=A0A1H1STW1_9MICO|nr:hypothetical protein [Agrococcus carbonis]SDS51361.1 hypothetical protein SAMN04489719_2494 [Agrococcus carbonis]